MVADGTLQRLWHVPVSAHTFSRARQVNPVLVRAFQAIRAADSNRRAGRFYASTDDLLRRVELPEFGELVQFIASALQVTVQQANAGMWPVARHALQLEIVGMWFQMQNGHAFHDIHTHGNCSWSGVYYAQIDEPDEESNTALVQPSGAEPLNGGTRFYSPLFPLLGGAYMDRGNAWLLAATFDHAPREGELLLFPSLLPHKALPYQGQKDRVIVSFNAQIRSPAGDRINEFSAL